MAVKINTLTEPEIRSIGEAFADHAYVKTGTRAKQIWLRLFVCGIGIVKGEE